MRLNKQRFVKLRKIALLKNWSALLFVSGRPSVPLPTWREWIFMKCGTKIGAHEGSPLAALRDIWQTERPRAHRVLTPSDACTVAFTSCGWPRRLQRRSRVGSIPSHSGGHGFKSRPFWLRFWVVFLSPSTQLPGQYKTQRHDRFNLHPFLLIIN